MSRDADHIECLELLARERETIRRHRDANAKLVEEQNQARAAWNAEVRALRDENAELRALVKHLETPAGALLSKVTRERDALLKAVQGVRAALGTLGGT